MREDQLELLVRRDLTCKLMEYKADFLANMDALGRLDLIFAKTKLARRYGCRRPVFSRDGSVTLRGLRHPQVAEDLLARGEAFTPLDLELNKGCTVITGANMGGKTVSLRSVVLSLLLFQCGFFVFAEEARLPLFHHVSLILADSGPGAGGLSSFGKEVHLLDRLLQHTRGSFFFVALDEFARGTNPQEGAALARALVRSHELDDSLALLREDLARLAACPETPAVSALSWPPRLPARKLAVAQVEGWRGEICHLAVTGTNGEPLVCKIVDPSFHNWPGLALAMRGGQISDFPLCNKSFNLSYCGHDL